MDQEARCAYIIAQAACANAEIAAMQAENQRMATTPGSKEPVFTHDDFMAIQDKYMISHNAVIGYLTFRDLG